MAHRLVVGLAAIAVLLGSPSSAEELSQQPVSNEAPAPADPHMAAAMELVDAANGGEMMAIQLQVVCNAYAIEYHQTHPRASNEDRTLFAATLSDEAGKSLDETTMNFAQALADHLSQEDLLALTDFARSDLYKRFIAALPQPLSGMGLFDLIEIAHSSDDASARRLYELFVKYVSADDLKAMNDFVRSDLGKRSVAALNKISSEMSYTPGWLNKAVEKAKDRTIARLRLKGVQL